MVSTTGAPAPVERALRPAYGSSLCVKQVRWARTVVDVAVRDLGQGAQRMHDRSGQPVVEFTVPYLGAAEVDRIGRHPAGLVVVAPWLTRLP